jgi:hypothetical protein
MADNTNDVVQQLFFAGMEPAPVPADTVSRYKNIPPFERERNGYGLLNMDYHFKPDGTVDWRKMVNPKYLYPNKEVFQKRKQEVPTSIEGLADEDLTVKLDGWKDLARIRGYDSIDFTIRSASETFVSVTCQIYWIPNCDTEMRTVRTSDGADAHTLNSSELGRNYLTSIALNRAFGRTVRNFLGIEIISQDEIGATQPVESNAPTTGTDVVSALAQALHLRKMTPDKFLAKLKYECVGDALNWESLKDIPKMTLLDLLDRVQNDKPLKD